MVLLRLTSTASRLTLGEVLDAKVTPLDEKKIREVFATAQGEMAIESFLGKLKAFWETYSVQFSVYKNKCRLIRGQSRVSPKRRALVHRPTFLAT